MPRGEEAFEAGGRLGFVVDGDVDGVVDEDEDNGDQVGVAGGVGRGEMAGAGGFDEAAGLGVDRHGVSIAGRCRVGGGRLTIATHLFQARRLGQLTPKARATGRIRV